MSQASMKTTHRLAAIGECMIEVGEQGHHPASVMQFSGDSLNMAVYFARSIDQQRLSVHYVTALGDDPYSDRMRSQWQQEGILTDLVRKIAGKLPGLYLIHNDEQGERTFYYYRSQAAAKAMFDGNAGEALAQRLLDFNTLYLSGISLAILHEEGRNRLLDTLKKAHEGGVTVCFDTNYRSRLWSDQGLARSVIQDVLQLTDIALPSFEDTQHLFDDSTPEETAKRLHDLGVKEVVVKQGEHGYLISDEQGAQQVPIQPVQHVIDTTSAGDSFNGAYLASRLQGLNPFDAARRAAELAAVVITHQGAIIPREKMP